MTHEVPPNLRIKRKWWGNTANSTGQFGWGSEYHDGRRWTDGLADSVEAAQAAAEADAQTRNVPAELIDLEGMRRRNTAIQAAGEAAQTLAAHRAAVVTGAREETPLDGSKCEPLEFKSGVVAIPTMGGILSELPLSAHDEDRFPDSVQLPVTVDAARDRASWVVCAFEGRGVAMTVTEAYERGLREARNWVPDLSGVALIPDFNVIQSKLDSQS